MKTLTLKKLNQIKKYLSLSKLLSEKTNISYAVIQKRLERGSPELSPGESKQIIKAISSLLN